MKINKNITLESLFKNYKKAIYCNVSQWLKMGFELVNGFIGYLQVVTTNNYNTFADFHTTKHSTLISKVNLH
jgi:regulation of enolase protein 1 (concanavalin A-like superfamily)